MKTSTTLNLSEEISKIEQRIPSQEYTLCKGLKQPFNHTNSGSRKIMQGIQMEQAAQLLKPEVPIVSTGFENQFGEFSSNFIRAEQNFVVVSKISKFKKDPNRHYWLILLNPENDELTCVERINYKHITEFYGYLFNNDYLDNLTVGSGIDKGDVIKKTISYDEYNNRAEGLNLTTMYIACEDVKEDPIVISESASKRFASPLIDKVEVKINDNDILLNLYGEGKQYKTFPDIGETVKNNILCVVRRELKDEEALFSQSWDRLKNIMMNDKMYIVDGTVIDIDVFCNNPEKLETSMYNSQIREYYEQSITFSKAFVDAVKPLLYDSNGNRSKLRMSYELQKQYHKAKSIVEGKQFIHEKVFNNIIMHIYVQQEKPLNRGDKITDRYGGKGVISKVKPDNMMPHYLKNGKWYPVDVQYSMCTCINRLNDGQLFETSLTYIGWQLIEYIKTNKLNYDQAFALIYKFIYMINPEEANMLTEMYQFTYQHPDDPMDENQFNRNMYIEQICHEGHIMLSIKPISNGITIDKINEIYTAFPFIKKHCPICVPMEDSNGNYRMVQTRRPITIGYKYIFRLKQLAEEKFSVVSLASTNIRNENSKSRMSKTHNARFASTPVRVYGEMETSTLTAHLGAEYIYQEFMLSSSSPMARRLHMQLLTGDAFAFDIELDEDCISQSADINQAYMKTIGLKLRFIKIEKFIRRPIMREVVSLVPTRKKRVIYQLPLDMIGNPEKVKKELDRLNELDKLQQQTALKEVVRIIPGIAEETNREFAYKEKLKRLGLYTGR